jgi:hypothetical protein
LTTPGVDEFDWERVVPRIVNPNKVAIIELLQRQREPLSASRMKNLIDNPEVTLQLLIYHCITLEKAGVLEIVPAPPSAAANERFYCLAPQE